MATLRPTFYELNESEVLSSQDLANGAIIFCKDSTNIYMTPVEGTATPVKMADTVIYLTNAAREALLAPINGKQYFCYDTGKMWMYYNGWVCINPDVYVEYDIPVDLPATGSVTVNDSRIKAGMTGTFYPSGTVEDLVSNITVVVSNGRAVISGTTDYVIPGNLKIKN